jgi:hypothetical protein
LAISALLFAVVVIALLFNVFNGDGGTAASTSTTPASSTIGTPQELEPIEILDVDCSQEGIGSLVCGNLISGSDSEYQFTWEEVEEGEPVTITLTFIQAMVVSRVDWVNLDDATQFKRNYRARGILIEADDSLQPTPVQLEDLAGSQSIPFAAIDTNSITITIESAYSAELVDGEIFREMAIEEIRVIGRPAVTGTTGDSGATTTTVPGSTTTTAAATSTTAAP